MKVGEEVLADLGVDMSCVLPVFNKMDRCSAETGAVNGGLAVSAHTGDGVDQLKAHLRERIADDGHPLGHTMPPTSA